MNLLFVTGCLEPGRDGVGDYSVRLATECNRLGHTCFLLALNDSFVSEPTESKKEDLVLLRLPASMQKNEKTKFAQKFAVDCKPDWFSLQFVSYAFDNRGFAFGLTYILRRIIGRAKVHVMFHELWIANDLGADFKSRLIGKLQRYSIKRMVGHLKPLVIHTSIPIFKKMLEINGLKSEILPLISNIPMNGDGNALWIKETLSLECGNEYFTVCIFGSLRPSWNPDPCLELLEKIRIEYKRSVKVVSIGRIGVGIELWNLIKVKYPNLDFVLVGEKSTRELSDMLHFANFGIITAPLLTLGKSGGYAAMFEHGLPVLCNPNELSFDFPIDDLLPEQKVFVLGEVQPQELVNASRYEEINLLEKVTNQFISELQNNDNRNFS